MNAAARAKLFSFHPFADGRMLRWFMLSLPVLVGCTQNAFTLNSQVSKLQADQTLLAQKNQELQNRATTLDRDNQELETFLAQSKQHAQRLEDHLSLMREQLRSTSEQLAQLTDEKQSIEQKTKAMTASAKRRGDVMITPNNSFSSALPTISLPEVEVRADGDVIRIELPADRIFDPGTPRLLTGAGMFIDTVATEVARTYPNQIIGIEGHTDTDTLLGAGTTSSHQLSVARATAVYDYLTTRNRLRADGLFIVGHGPNHPVVSNATPAGKARNRRVEIVIYPEMRR